MPSIDHYPLKAALLSVTDKSGLDTLASALKNLGVTLYASGGTKKFLTDKGIETLDAKVITQSPEAFDGRMKTISFNLGSALLYKRESEADRKEKNELNIPDIDLVVCNLYPFENHVRQNSDDDTLIENIDIGGPLMIRAAAKNFKAVTTLTSPDQYLQFIEHLTENQGTLFEYRRNLALKAFQLITHYDSAISNELSLRFSKTPSKTLTFENQKNLRYGENPHQEAWVYKWENAQSSLTRATIHQGKELSYNNLLDADAAWKIVSDLKTLGTGHGCAVIKHGNPCGLALSQTSSVQALEQAWTGDPISAFGSIIAFTDTFTHAHLEFLDKKFVEIIMAPNFEGGVLSRLRERKNLRVLELPLKEASEGETTIRSILGGVIIQNEDEALPLEFNTVTNNKLQSSELSFLRFGTIAAKYLKSNAIALVYQNNETFELIGAGMGQPNRLDSLKRLAAPRASQRDFDISKSLLVSDAFFPFSDSIEAAYEVGIKNIIQPGGSIRDEEVIAKANELGIAMAFTKMRHFRH